MSTQNEWEDNPLVAVPFVADDPNIALVQWRCGYAVLHGSRYARERFSHIFSAAPKLLEAARYALDRNKDEWSLTSLGPDVEAMLEEAIAKAEGRG